MRYLKPIFVMYTASVLLGLIHLIIRNAAAPDDHFYKFIYDRGPIQHVTMFAACVVIILLCLRCGQHILNSKRFSDSVANRALPPWELARQMEAVHQTYSEDGMRAAVARADELSKQQKEELAKAHETINHLTGILPVLGFLGTLLGLNQGLFLAFASGTPKTDAVMKFVTAFATTLDNTILAVFCAVPLFALAFILARWEEELVSKYAAHVWKHFGLKRLPENDKTAEVLQAELTALAARMAEETKTALASAIESAVEVCGDRLDRVIKNVIDGQRQHGKSVVKNVSSELTGQVQSLKRVGEWIEQQHGELADKMRLRIDKLEEALCDRSPQEVVLRYHHNGHAK